MPWKPDYTSVALLKDYLRISDTVDDVFMATCVTTASRAIDHETRRQFGQVAVAAPRTFDLPKFTSVRDFQYKDIDDIGNVTGLLVTMNAIDITAKCRLEPLNALDTGDVYTAIRVPGDLSGDLIVTARWGWAVIPPTVAHATLILASRFFTRRDAPFGIIGGPELGNQFYISKSDPDVAMMVRQFYRWW